MSDLLTGLASAARALDAQSLGLEVTGQNIANINTPGYSRRTVQFAEVPGHGPTSAGSGVTATGVKASRAPLIEAQLRREQPAQGREAALAATLSRVDATLGSPGSSLDASLTSFYASFSALASDPGSGVARQQVAVQGQSLAGAFNDVAGRLQSAQSDANKDILADVDQINTLAAQIASLNASLTTAGGSNESTRDQIGSALSSLSQLIDIGVVTQDDGRADVSVGNGKALVVGGNAYTIATTPAAVTGLADLTIGSATITSEITGGAIGGSLSARDVLIPGYRSRLDQLAYGVATTVNAAHQAGFDLSGAPGGDFFAAPAAVAGSAASLAVSASIVANPSTIAAAGAPAAGDNSNARAIANLAAATLPGLGTNPVDTWGGLVYRVGTDAAVASQEQASRDEVVSQLTTLRDQVSGVSLDEEASNMMKFQRAYEANARYFSAVQTSLSTLMQLLGS